jgi:hypothetical protein
LPKKILENGKKKPISYPKAGWAKCSAAISWALFNILSFSSVKLSSSPALACRSPRRARAPSTSIFEGSQRPSFALSQKANVPLLWAF